MILVLTGFMMCGKSSYGRALAERLGVPFMDLDDHIEEGVAASDIIRSKGEEVFRAEETAALERMLAREGDFILALGGGTPVREANRRLLAAAPCSVVWLKASLEESVFNPQWASLAAQRPLLDGGDRGRIVALWESRIPAYTSVADHILVTDNKTPGQILSELEVLAHLTRFPQVNSC